MPRAYYDPYGIFPAPKTRKTRSRRQRNQFDSIFSRTNDYCVQKMMKLVDTIWQLDHQVSEILAKSAAGWTLFDPIAKLLEWIMHGALWLVCVVSMIYTTNSKAGIHLLVNLLFAYVNRISWQSLLAETRKNCRLRFQATQPLLFLRNLSNEEWLIALLLGGAVSSTLYVLYYLCVRSRGDRICPSFTSSYRLYFQALVLDLATIGVMKGIFRRSRPQYNRTHMIAQAPYVDQFSFPSGHSSRAAMLTKLLFALSPVELRGQLLILAFPFMLAMSRVMLGRHYCSDVIVGLLVGCIECDLVLHFWLAPELCFKFSDFVKMKWLMKVS